MYKFVGKISVVFYLFIFLLMGCGVLPADQIDEVEPAPLTEITPAPEVIEAVSPILPESPLPEPTVADVIADEPVSMIENDKLVAVAVTDLIQSPDIEAEDVVVVSSEKVQWPDASLGCPEEGIMYAQVVTPGFRIVLEANGTQYVYHTDDTDNVFQCENS